jgi:hypothetical protein
MRRPYLGGSGAAAPFGRSSAGAAFGGKLNLPWLPLAVYGIAKTT